MKNPVLTASGTFGYGLEYADVVDLNRLGGIVVKGTTLRPRLGNPPPRMVETVGGMLSACGLQNIGVDAFVREKLPLLRRFDTAVIVNIAGATVEEFAELTGRLSKAEGVHALEVNVSCPNADNHGMAFGVDGRSVAEVVRAVKLHSRCPVIVKLTPNVTDIVEIARHAEDAGADAISLINALLGMAVDVRTRRPRLGNITGGLTGPCIKPVALRMVWEVSRAVSVPVIGIGGITTATDALEFMLVGATAVQVGTGSFKDPRTVEKVVDGMKEYLANHGMNDIKELIGSLRLD